MAMIGRESDSTRERSGSPPLLSVTDLARAFDGVQAVDGLSFDIGSCGVAALIGPNGAGKTTAFNAITGFLRPYDGAVQFKGMDITRARPNVIARMGIGRTFQDCKVFPQLPVLDNVVLGFRDYGNETLLAALSRSKPMIAAERDKKDRACALLEYAGLLEKRSELAGSLSFGQRKLLDLCKVQALDPDLFLLDEPMSGLFPAMVVKMEDMIQRLRETGKAILFIEHNMKVVMDISDRVLVLNFGKLIGDGKPDDIQRNPAVLEAYLGRKIDHAS